MSKNTLGKSFQLIYLLVAFLVFVYLVLRAIYVPPLMDEVTTFFFYVQPGSMQPGYAFLDANNHIFNSFLAHLCYLLLGDGIFVIRIPSLIGFIVYAFYGFKIYNKLENPFAKFAWMVLIFGTEYFIEFFNISRGYGLSFAFLLGVFYHLKTQYEHKKISDFIAGTICNLLMILSNLSLLTWSPILFAIAIFLVLIKKRNIVGYISIALTVIIYTLVYLYLYDYAELLRAKGRLYLYAGDTFYDAIYKGLCIELGLVNFKYGQYLVIPLLTLLPIVFVANIKRMGKIEYASILSFIGFNLVFIALHDWMKVNYPPNRAAIQIYLVLILAYVLVLNKNKIKIIQYIAIAPIIYIFYFFITHVNITYNSHWKGEAIPYSFVEIVSKANQNEQVPYSVSVNPLEGNTWDYYNYLNNYSINFAKTIVMPNFNTDIVVISRDFNSIVVPANYDTIGFQESTGHLLLKRKKATYQYNELSIPDINSKAEFIGFYTLPLDSCTMESIKVGIRLTLVQSNIQKGAFLAIGTDKESGSFDLMKIKKNKEISLSHSIKLHPGDTKLNIYIWNIDKTPFIIKNIHLYFEKCQ